MKNVLSLSGGRLLPAVVLAAVTIAVNACKKHAADPAPATTIPGAGNNSGTPDGCAMVYTFYAGQHIDVGTVTVSNDDDSVYVTYQTQNGWVMNQTHLYVGTAEGIPVNNSGNPTIGQFPYAAAHDGVTSYTVAVPITPGQDCYAIAAHAAVSLVGTDNTVLQTETAWSNGSQINQSGSWATYSEYCVVDCGCTYETISYDYLAGQSIPIGALQVTNDADNLYVTFHFTDNWYTGQTHLYVGSLAGLPVNGQNNPVPGQFPHAVTHDPMTQSYTYTIPLTTLDSCYIIAAHAEMSLLDGNGNVTQTETGWSYGTGFPGASHWGWYSDYCTQTCP